MFGSLANKAVIQQYELDINQARLKRPPSSSPGPSNIEDLVAKYHRKLNSASQGSVLGYLALAEGLFEYPQLAFDGFEILPSSQASPEFVKKSEKCKELLLSSISAAQSQQAQPPAPVNVAHANTMLALYELLAGQSGEALQRLQSISQSSLEEAAKDLATYGPTSLVIFYVVYAWALYQDSKLEDAKLITEKGISFISSISLSSTAAPNDSEAFLWWAETCIYTMIALCKSGDAERATPACTLFLNRFPTFKFRDNLKAIAIFYSHIKCQIGKLDQPPPFNGIPEFAPGSLKRASAATSTLLKEIAKWLPHYESLVTKVYSFPKGGSKTPLELERYSRVMQAYEWWVRVEMYRGKIGEDSLAEYLDRHYSILETLYRGTNHAFHSLHLLRYISHTFFSLLSISPFNLCREEVKEAKKAVESYMFHWEKHFTLLLDTKKKEKLVKMQQKNHNRMSTSSRPYQSHRMSGSITQYPELATFTLALESPVEEVDDENPTASGVVLTPPKLSHTGTKSPRVSFLGDEEGMVPVVIIEEVDGETVADVVGVLITGMRLLLQTYEGNAEVLKNAATYGEKAFVILTEHGTSLSNYNFILGQVFQWLGVVYGELSLEVVGREDRLRHQEEAIIMLSKARALQKTNHTARYQLALQLSEVGEFQQAVDEINKAITLDPTVPSYYNLLALMLSAKSQIDKALVLANAGWSHCLKHLLTANNVENESQLPWENVDYYYRDDLVNLRLTIVSLEIKKYGPKSVMDSLPVISTHLRRIAGVKASAQEEAPKKAENERVSVLSTGHLRKSISFSKTNPSVSSASNILPSGIHRIGHFDLQLNLCLLSSSVYRECGLMENALSAIEDGEKMLLTLSRLQHNIRNQESRIYRDSEVKAGQITSSSGYWKDIDPVLARFQADIALEKAFIQYAIYKAQTKPKPTSPYIKYLSPLARIEVDRQAALRKDSRRAPKFGSVGSINDSSDSMSMSQISTSSEAQNASGVGLDANGNPPFLKAQAPEYPIDDDENSNKIVTIDRVITSVQFALLFDMHHLPARTFLGMLLREKGDLGQSEHHLQRACTQQKHRGSSSGRSGMGSVFGGVSSQWGWLSWNQLALSLYDLGRTEDSEKAALYSLQLQQNCSTRGYECLTRFL